MELRVVGVAQTLSAYNYKTEREPTMRNFFRLLAQSYCEQIKPLILKRQQLVSYLLFELSYAL